MSTPAENVAEMTAEVDSGAEVEVGAESAPAAVETGKTGKPPHDPDLQARFDKLTREKYEGLSRADRAEYRAQLAEQRLADIEAAKTQTVAPSDDYPTLESVGYDENLHRQKVSEWSQRQATTTAREAARQELAREREVNESRQAATTWKQSESEFIKATPDYVEKVQQAATLPISEEAQARLSKLTDGPRLAYALVENRDKALAIMHLPIDVQMLEIGRIAGRIEALKTAPPPVSKAPPPVGKIEGSESAASAKVDTADSDNLSDAEWTRRRNAQELARRRARNG